MIDRMGDKASASTMIEAGVSCVPGSVGILIVRTSKNCLTIFPVMPCYAGGGKGMRAVWKEEDLLKAWKDSSRVCCCW
jgi:acetyl-CoA carboxylase biotin carboxylase subunit